MPTSFDPDEVDGFGGIFTFGGSGTSSSLFSLLLLSPFPEASFLSTRQARLTSFLPFRSPFSADSYYEYLIKQHQLLQGRLPQYARMVSLSPSLPLVPSLVSFRRVKFSPSPLLSSATLRSLVHSSNGNSLLNHHSSRHFHPWKETRRSSLSHFPSPPSLPSFPFVYSTPSPSAKTIGEVKDGKFEGSLEHLTCFAG